MEWRSSAPWISDVQVEQDLLICRVLISLFSNKLIAENLAFRGGTALHKLFLKPPLRYSENVDLVQVKAGPIGPVINAIHETLDGVFGTPRRKQAEDSMTLIYRKESEIPPVIPMKLKLEINTREHFSVLGYQEFPFVVESRWYSGSCKIKTYSLEELLATKLRALYQRRKGRDLFDLWLGLTFGKANPAEIREIFLKYMEAEGHSVSRTEFRKNVTAKMKTQAFLPDTDNLLRPAIRHDPQEAALLIGRQLLQLL